MTLDESIINATDQALIQFLANATETYYGCAGHTKAEMNEQRIKAYIEELQKRNVVIPDTDTLLKNGVYNGEGSF